MGLAQWLWGFRGRCGWVNTRAIGFRGRGGWDGLAQGLLVLGVEVDGISTKAIGFRGRERTGAI